MASQLESLGKKDALTVIGEWLPELCAAESVALTVCEALKGMDTTESRAAEETLRVGCADRLFSVIARADQ